MAKQDKTIQGYSDGVFWGRNTLNEQINGNKKKNKVEQIEDLFDHELV